MTQSPPHTIAYVDHADQVGGAEKSLCELVAHLDRDRFNPVIIHRPDAGWLRYAEGIGADLRATVPSSSLYDAKRTDLGGGLAGLHRLIAGVQPIGRLWRELGAVRPALVHTNSTKMHLMAGAAARARGLPVVWHMRDLMTDGDARAWLARAVARIRPEVIAISRAVAAQFEGLSCAVHLVPNGIPIERFTPGPPPESLRAELGLPADVPIACIVGRLAPWKGHRALLRAWPLVLESVPDAHLLVAGEVAFWDDSYADELYSTAEDLGIGPRVVWAGFREDVPDILRLSDLLVLASTDEPFGRVLIEAMAAGLPVVATDAGGVPEIVSDGETGVLVPPGEHEPLADAIVEVLSAPSRAEAMGQAGRRRALECFDVRRVARQVGEIYERVLG